MVFATYMKAIGYLLTILILASYILQNVAQISSSIWLSRKSFAFSSTFSLIYLMFLSEWSTDPLNDDGSQNGTEVRLAVYGVLGFVQGS